MVYVFPDRIQMLVVVDRCIKMSAHSFIPPEEILRITQALS